MKGRSIPFGHQVHSRCYHLRFDASDGGLGYIVPVPLPSPDSWDAEHGGTGIVLPLQGSAAEVQSTICQMQMHMRQISPTLLLFLRKISTMELVDRVAGVYRRIRRTVESGLESRAASAETLVTNGVEIDEAGTKETCAYGLCRLGAEDTDEASILTRGEGASGILGRYNGERVCLHRVPGCVVLLEEFEHRIHATGHTHCGVPPGGGGQRTKIGRWLLVRRVLECSMGREACAALM